MLAGRSVQDGQRESCSQFISIENFSPSMDSDEHPFLIGFDDDLVVIILEENESSVRMNSLQER